MRAAQPRWGGAVSGTNGDGRASGFSGTRIGSSKPASREGGQEETPAAPGRTVAPAPCCRRCGEAGPFSWPSPRGRHRVRPPRRSRPPRSAPRPSAWAAASISPRVRAPSPRPVPRASPCASAACGSRAACGRSPPRTIAPRTRLAGRHRHRRRDRRRPGTRTGLRRRRLRPRTRVLPGACIADADGAEATLASWGEAAEPGRIAFQDARGPGDRGPCRSAASAPPSMPWPRRSSGRLPGASSSVSGW